MSIGIQILQNSIDFKSFMKPLSENDNKFFKLTDIIKDLSSEGINEEKPAMFKNGLDQYGSYQYTFSAILDPDVVQDSNLKRLRFRFFTEEFINLGYNAENVRKRKEFQSFFLNLEQQYEVDKVTTVSSDEDQTRTTIFPSTTKFHFFERPRTSVQRGNSQVVPIKSVLELDEDGRIQRLSRSTTEERNLDFINRNIRISNELSSPLSHFPLPSSKLSMTQTRAGLFDIDAHFSKEPGINNLKRPSTGKFCSLNAVSFTEVISKNQKNIRSRLSDKELLDFIIELRDSNSNFMNMELKTNHVRCVERLITIDFNIPRSIVGADDFGVEITPLYNDDGDNTEKECVKTFITINNSDISDLFLSTPIVPPSIKLLANTPRRCIIEVKRNDPSNTAIKLFRQEYDPSTNLYSKPSLVGEIQPDEPNIISDNNINNYYPKKIVYKAIQEHGRLTDLVGCTSSIMVPGLRSGVHRSSQPYNTSTIICENRVESVKILVTNISSNIKKIRLIRERLTSSGMSTNERVTIPFRRGVNEVFLQSDMTTTNFSDFTTTPGLKYRYYLVMLDAKGKEFVSDEEEFLERLVPSLAKDSFSVSINGPTIEDSTAVFNIQTRPTRLGVNFLEESLSEIGRKELLDSNSKSGVLSKDFVVFSVDEINHSTGRRKSIGFCRSGKFSVPLISDGSTRTYQFNMCLVAPEAIVPNVEIKLSRPGRPGDFEKKYRANKFKSSLLTRVGAVPSSRRLNSFDIDGAILLGKTGYSISRTVDSTKNKSKITSPTISESSSYASIFWDLTKDQASKKVHENFMVDYFIVCCKLNGNMLTLGTVENTKESGRFYFTDKNVYREVGTKEYFIIGICNDVKNSVVSSSVSSNRRFSIPEEIVESSKAELIGVN